MKKSLIVPALVAMLAVGCNKQESKVKTVPFLVDDVAAFYADNFGIEMPADKLPGYPSKSGNAVLTFDDSWLDYTGAVGVYVDNTSKREAAAYVESLKKAGWTLDSKVDDEENDTTYQLSCFEVGNADYYASCFVLDYVTSNQYVDIMFGVAPKPSESWPAIKVASQLEAMGTVETIPAPEFEAEYYIFTGTQIAAFVGVGQEAEAVTSYQSTLTTATFAEAELDKWGDMHYSSPRGEIDVCIWDGNDAGTPAPGFVYIDLEVSVEYTYAKLDADLVAVYPNFYHEPFPESSASSFYFDSLVADSTLAATQAIADYLPLYLYEITAPEVQEEGTEKEMGFAQYTDEDMGFAISVYVFPGEGEFGGMITLQPVPESTVTEEI